MSQQNTPSKRERRDAARAERLERAQADAASAARRKRLTQLGALLAAAVVIVVVAVAVSSGGGSDKSSSSGAGSGGALQGVAETKSLIGGIPQKGITLGKATAPVTIVEFADPQCPFCRDYTINEMPALIQKYVRTGKAKMELRYLTFIGPDSLKAASVLEAAGQQNRLWESSDLFYRNQGEENSGYVTDAFLTKVLEGAGADADKAIAEAGSAAVTAQLGAAKTLASRHGVNATPTIVVGPTGGELKADSAESQPTAAGVGKLVDAALAAKGQ